jgi:hypothetical protein
MHTTCSKLLLSAILVLSSGAWSPLGAAPQPADDDEAIVPEGPVEESAKPKNQPAPPADNDELRTTDESDLAHQIADEIDRLERAIGGMRSAQKRIAGSDTSPETQKIQERVIQDLERLLAFLKKQQNRRSSQQNQNDNQQDQQNERLKLEKSQGNPQNSGSKKGTDPKDSQGDRRSDDKSTDSQERSDAARAKAADESRRLQLIKDVWGHLPPHLRDAMQTAFSEKYLPKYEDLVKKYYEALAEKNRKRSGK